MFLLPFLFFCVLVILRLTSSQFLLSLPQFSSSSSFSHVTSGVYNVYVYIYMCTCCILFPFLSLFLSRNAHRQYPSASSHRLDLHLQGCVFSLS